MGRDGELAGTAGVPTFTLRMNVDVACTQEGCENLRELLEVLALRPHPCQLSQKLGARPGPRSFPWGATSGLGVVLECCWASAEVGCAAGQRMGSVQAGVPG